MRKFLPTEDTLHDLRIRDLLTRRGFLKKSALATLGTSFASNFWGAVATDPYAIISKHPGLTILNDRPWNVETPAHLLDDEVTPAKRLFIRNNGIPPSRTDAANWTLKVGGESAVREKTFTLQELKLSFTNHTMRLTLECGGNGRSEFNPPASGNQWTTGAVGCPEWTGVRVRDVLESVGIKDDAVYIGYYGADRHLSGDPEKNSISRGVPMSKALEPESLLVWAMNGKDLPPMNGYPLRLVFGGWPASTGGKWLSKIVIRNKVHDGQKMGGKSYRVPCEPVTPGSEVADEDMCIIESMPVKSLITYPRTGVVIPEGKTLPVRGHAWAGDFEVSTMRTSVDFGATWQICQLEPPANRLAWQRWRASVNFPGKGYYEVWARASDNVGKSQPMVVPGWNPKGYLNNACHRIAVKIV